MSNISHRYIFLDYVNLDNLDNIRSQIRDIYRTKYVHDTGHITISETNSLDKDEYFIGFESAEIDLVSSRSESKESMLHQQESGDHRGRHLQFQLRGKDNKTIQINLEILDGDDFDNCIRGFLSLVKILLENEQKKQNISDNLVSYFFNEKINNLESHRRFLLDKIKDAHLKKQIKFSDGTIVNNKEISHLKKEPHLSLFFDELG